MHTLIIGGGVIGLMTALELVHAGQQVTILDQGEFGQESSWAGGGILSPLYPWRYGAAVHALAQGCKAAYNALSRLLLSETGIDIEVSACGMLMLNTPQMQLEAQTWYKKHSKVYIPPVEITLKEALAINPQINRHAPSNFLWDQHIAQVRNPRLIQALVAYLQKKGVALVAQTQVTRFITRQQQVTTVIDQHNKNWQADNFVICCGAWSGLVASLVNTHIDVRPIRGQMLLFKTPSNWLPSMVMQDGVYLIPRLDGHILCGSTLEDVGFDKTINPDSSRMLKTIAFNMLPTLAQANLVKVWTGLRPASPNNVPFIDKAPNLDNVWINAGHFRYGLVFAPRSAKRLIEIMKL